jgi:hypothetical protein
MIRTVGGMGSARAFVLEAEIALGECDPAAVGAAVTIEPVAEHERARAERLLAGPRTPAP